MSTPLPDAASAAGRSLRSLSYSGSYKCPVCRHGQITGLTLMDAFACDFCRHIFTANLVEQTVQVVDSAQPMAWRWTGRSWQNAFQRDPSLTWVLWVGGGGLVIFPALLVWLSAYTFPPLPGSAWAWFPSVWLGCTLLAHLLMVTWLLAEHYQLPLYVATKMQIRAFTQR